MPVSLPLRCRCGRVRGIASDVSPSSGFRFVCYCKDCQAFARFRSGGRARPRRRNRYLPHGARARKTHRGHGRAAMPSPLRQGFALVQRMLPDADCQHSRRAGLPGHRHGSLLHGPRGLRSFPGRGTGSAALPHLRTLCHRAAPTEHARSAVCRDVRPPRVKAARLVDARAQSADAVLRRSDEGTARRAAQAHGKRARRSLSRFPIARSPRIDRK
jgi:hypothetical protein